MRGGCRGYCYSLCGVRYHNMSADIITELYVMSIIPGYGTALSQGELFSLAMSSMIQRAYPTAPVPCSTGYPCGYSICTAVLDTSKGYHTCSTSRNFPYLPYVQSTEYGDLPYHFNRIYAWMHLLDAPITITYGSHMILSNDTVVLLCITL